MNLNQLKLTTTLLSFPKIKSLCIVVLSVSALGCAGSDAECVEAATQCDGDMSVQTCSGGMWGEAEMCMDDMVCGVMDDGMGMCMDATSDDDTGEMEM